MTKAPRAAEIQAAYESGDLALIAKTHIQDAAFGSHNSKDLLSCGLGTKLAQMAATAPEELLHKTFKSLVRAFLGQRTNPAVRQATQTPLADTLILFSNSAQAYPSLQAEVCQQLCGIAATSQSIKRSKLLHGHLLSVILNLAPHYPSKAIQLAQAYAQSMDFSGHETQGEILAQRTQELGKALETPRSKEAICIRKCEFYDTLIYVGKSLGLQCGFQPKPLK